MKERPILFSAPMVRSLLAGAKTQTRRALRNQPSAATTHYLNGVEREFDRFWPCSDADYTGDAVRCPYGVPGDRLWVRETWARRLDEDHIKPRDLPTRWAWYWADHQTCNTGCAGAAGRHRPSIHMPRWASRITLEVANVNCRRLNRIAAEDAIAEGIPADDPTPRLSYAALWESINGLGSWASNPWVWVVEFKLLPER